MPRPLRKHFPGARYHVTCRGNGRQRIFLCRADYRRFVQQLHHALAMDQVILYGWVCMPNHYHLFVETLRANVSQFLQRLNTAYSMYWCQRHRRPGHVLQGRYKAKLVAGDKYLLGLSRYIHLNPIKSRQMRQKSQAERLEYLSNWVWSSYRGYVWERYEEEEVDYRWRAVVGGVDEQEQRRRYRQYVERFVMEDDEETQRAMNRSEYAIGDEEYVKGVERELLGRKAEQKEQKDVQWPQEEVVAVEVIDEEVAKAYGLVAKDLKGHGRRVGEAKGVAIELACRMSGKSQRDVGRHYGGLTCSAVSYQRKMLRERAEEEGARQKKLSRIEKRIRQKL